MSQQWQYHAVCVPAKGGPWEVRVNAELANAAAQGWELVNGSYGTTMIDQFVWLFLRRPMS